MLYGSADQTIVNDGGIQEVNGNATNTTVNSGGVQLIYQDGTAADTTLNAGAVQIDWSFGGGNTTINGGTQYVIGIDSVGSATIEAGEQYVSGAIDTDIIEGGIVHVNGGQIGGVEFDGSSGTLDLDHASDVIGGGIVGFQSGNAIDLRDISFSSTGTTAQYDSRNSELLVSDGSNVGMLMLFGQYTASSFALSSDGHGGTLITDADPVNRPKA